MVGIPRELQDLHDEFYMWVGMCISGWARVEDELFRICWKALGCAEKQAAIVFFKSPALETRLTLTDELVQAAFPKIPNGAHPHQDQKFWKTEVIARFDKLKPVRNQIAHHPAAPKSAITDSAWETHAFGGEAFGGATTVSWFEIYVSDAQMLRGRDDQTRPLLVGDLKAHYLLTLGLAEVLKDFYWRFLTHAPKPADTTIQP